MTKNNPVRLDDPTIVDGYAFWYYTCDRDPTPSEDVVTDIGLPSDPMWLQYWVNTNTNDVFMLMNYVADSLIWLKITTPTNILNMINGAGWDVNTVRNYAASGVSLNTSRQVSTTNDTFVLASLNLVNTVLTSTTVLVQTSPDNSTFSTIATIADATGVAANLTEAVSFIVPANYYYKLVTSGSGTVTLTSCNELSL